jgi:transposase-like protein
MSSEQTSRLDHGDQTIKQTMVVAALVQGATVAEAARRADVKPSLIRYWKANDERFNQMLEAAEERAVNAIIDEGIGNVRQQIKELGPMALAVLRSSLDSHDDRIKLTAAQQVLRIGGVMERESVIKQGLESEIARLNTTRPQDGD